MVVDSIREWLTDRRRVDSMRGLACLLLVYYHTVVDFSNYNGQSLTLLREVNAILADMRMPLFSFISGLIFAYKPHQSKSRKFIEKKFQRLIIPFCAMTLILLGVKTIYPNASSPASIADIPHYLAYGYSHLWFLQAIFLIFCFYSLLHAAMSVGPSHYVLAFACSLAAYLSPLTNIEILSVGKAFYLIPFFTLGMIATTYLAWIVSCRKLLIALGGVCFFGALYLAVYGNITAGQHSEENSLVVGLSFLLLIYLLFPRITSLYRVGAYSFTIFLFHSIFIALGVRLFPAAPLIGLPLTVALAVLAPIAVEVFVERFTPALRFGLGKGFN